MRSQILQRMLVGLTLILSSTSILVAQEFDPEFIKTRAVMNREARPYTTRLPKISRIELLKVGQLTEGGGIVSIEASKLIEGRQALRIASVWRSQSWDYKHGGMCHYPGYVIKFYSENKLILHATVCWQCGNIEFLEPRLRRLHGFIPDNRAAKLLLQMFNDALSKSAE